MCIITNLLFAQRCKLNHGDSENQPHQSENSKRIRKKWDWKIKFYTPFEEVDPQGIVLIRLY